MKLLQQMSNPQQKLETTQEEEAPAKSSTPDIPAQEAADPLQQLLAMITPLLEFHKVAESAEDADIRLFWDVRLLKGKAEPLVSVKGSSSLPGALRGAQQAKAPTLVYQEIVEKIATPLLARMQDLVNAGALDALSERTQAPRLVNDETVETEEEDPDADLGPGTAIAEAAAAAANNHE